MIYITNVFNLEDLNSEYGAHFSVPVHIKKLDPKFIRRALGMLLLEYKKFIPLITTKVAAKNLSKILDMHLEKLDPDSVYGTNGGWIKLKRNTAILYAHRYKNFLGKVEYSWYLITHADRMPPLIKRH